MHPRSGRSDNPASCNHAFLPPFLLPHHFLTSYPHLHDPDAPSTVNVPPLTVESSRITLLGPVFPFQAHATVPSPTSAPRMVPPMQGSVFAPSPPNCASGIAPLGLAILLLLQAFTFPAAVPLVLFTLSTHFPNQLHKK
jgi:hypothetical protein